MNKCECGCGQETPIIKQIHKSYGGRKLGQHTRFISGHNLRVQPQPKPPKGINKGAKNGNWNGGMINSQKSPYKFILMPEHPRANYGYVPEHIVIAEKVMGKLLPRGTMIHHVDGNGKNNERSNLVVCPNDAYHQFLHSRTRALKKFGKVNLRQCTRCKMIDFIWNFPQRKSGINYAWCLVCKKKYDHNYNITNRQKIAVRKRLYRERSHENKFDRQSL